MDDPGSGFATSTPPRTSFGFSASPAPAIRSTAATGDHKTSSEPSAGKDHEAELEQTEEAALFAARSYVTSKDFSRAVHVLRNCRSAKAQFLSIYCQFLVSSAGRVFGMLTIKT